MTDDLYERYKEALRVGHVAVLRGALQEALTAYRLASSIAPSRALPHTSLGGVLLRLGHLEEALVEYASAVARAPHDEGALLGQAEALTIAGQRFDAAMALDHVSEIQEASGRLPEAADTIRRALELEEAPERIRRQRTLMRDIRLSAGDHAAEQLLARALRLREEPGGPMETARTVVASTPVTGEAVPLPPAPVAMPAEAPAWSASSPDRATAAIEVVAEEGQESWAAPEIVEDELVAVVAESESAGTETEPIAAGETEYEANADEPSEEEAALAAAAVRWREMALAGMAAADSMDDAVDEASPVEALGDEAPATEPIEALEPAATYEQEAEPEAPVAPEWAADDVEGEPQWAVEAPAAETDEAAAAAATAEADEAAAWPEAEPLAATRGPREAIEWPDAEPVAAVRPPREHIEWPEAEPVAAVRPPREPIAWPEAEPIAHARAESAGWTQPAPDLAAALAAATPAATPETASPVAAAVLPPEVAAVIAAAVRNEPSAIGVMDGGFDTPIGVAPGVVGESVHQPTGDELLAAAEAADLAGDSTTLRSLLLWTARAYAREGRFEAGLDATHRLLQRSPSDVDAHLVLVELYVARDWNSLAADKLVLLGRLAELNNDQETRQRLGAVASRVFPKDRRLESLYH
jgi:tetratricopeptide (TPR) repeat protein